MGCWNTSQKVLFVFVFLIKKTTKDYANFTTNCLIKKLSFCEFCIVNGNRLKCNAGRLILQS